MGIPTRVLGKTGEKATALGLGGVCWNLVEDDASAVQVVHRAIDLGITYLDTASGYKESERRLGLALKERDRSGVFVATKCLKRAGDEAEREIAESFERLQLDTIDLMQLHAADEVDGGLSAMLGPGGALRIIDQYRRAGRIRFVGLTGHTHPERFVELIGEYDFDTILFPVGAVNRVANDFVRTVVPAARARGMGVIGMKVMAYGQVPAESGHLFLRYALGLPIDVAIVGMDTCAQVEENVRVAVGAQPLSPDEEQTVLAQARELVRTHKKEDLWWLPAEAVGT